MTGHMLTLEADVHRRDRPGETQPGLRNLSLLLQREAGYML